MQQGPWKYSRHYREDAQGHIFMPNAVGACTIRLVGAALMSQEQLDACGEIMAAAPRLVEALQTIQARINGEWDHPALVKLGPLNTDKDIDILRIIESVKTCLNNR